MDHTWKSICWSLLSSELEAGITEELRSLPPHHSPPSNHPFPAVSPLFLGGPQNHCCSCHRCLGNMGCRGPGMRPESALKGKALSQWCSYTASVGGAVEAVSAWQEMFKVKQAWLVQASWVDTLWASLWVFMVIVRDASAVGCRQLSGLWLRPLPGWESTWRGCTRRSWSSSSVLLRGVILSTLHLLFDCFL